MSRVALTLGFAVLVAAIGIRPASVLAHDYTIGGLKITHLWAQATPKGSSVAGGYLTITNTGSIPDRLIGGFSDEAERLEIHQTRMENDVATMREKAGGLEIKPGETLEFKPNGYHLMFVEPKKQLTQGERINATLKFEKAGTVNVYFHVVPIGAQGPEHGHHVTGTAGHEKK